MITTAPITTMKRLISLKVLVIVVAHHRTFQRLTSPSHTLAPSPFASFRAIFFRSGSGGPRWYADRGELYNHTLGGINRKRCLGSPFLSNQSTLPGSILFLLFLVLYSSLKQRYLSFVTYSFHSSRVGFCPRSWTILCQRSVIFSGWRTP